jgi:hypothetical protein
MENSSIIKKKTKITENNTKTKNNRVMFLLIKFLKKLP